MEATLIVAVLACNVAASEWLCRHTFLRHLGSALLVIVLTAIVANLGWIPTGVEPVAVYDGVFAYVAPLAIFWLLLGVNLRSILDAGVPLVLLFLIGSLGTVAGVLGGMAVAGGPGVFGQRGFALGGMFVATYTGGSANFNSVALEYGVVKDGALYAAASVVDSAMTTVWMAVTVFLPRVLLRLRPAAHWRGKARGAGAPITGVEDDTESVHPLDLALLLGLGAFALWISLRWSGTWQVPSILILTSLALVLAQFGAIRRLAGARVMGLFCVQIFLAVIGALCDLEALRGIGPLGVSLMVLVSVAVCVHGVVVFAAAWLLRLEPPLAAVASQANIGGGTSALALARSLGRSDLVLPAVLVGSLGTALGSYLGFFTAGLLR